MEIKNFPYKVIWSIMLSLTLVKTLAIIQGKIIRGNSNSMKQS